MRDATGAYRHVVVVGGTSEIASAMLERLIDEGTNAVTLLARDAAAARAVPLPDRIERHIVEFDATRADQHASVARQAAAGTQDIDLVLVASGMLGDADLAAHDPVHAAEITATTFTGSATMTGALAEILAGQGHGAIVVLSSVAGVRVRGDNHVYGAAKAGLDGFTQGLAHRLRGTGVEVLIVRPGHVRTRMSADMPEAPFAVSADELAEDVMRALARGQSVVWSPRVLGLVMAVMRVIPNALFRAVASRARRSS